MSSTPVPNQLGRSVRTLANSVLRAVREVDARTPPERDRSVDGIRAAAICAVVLGHWLVTAPTLWEDGALRVSSPLRAMPDLAFLSWLLQALALFFFVGGYSAARGYDRARGRGEGYPGWLRTRIARLGRPVVVVTAVWGAAVTLMSVAGVPEATLRTSLLMVLQPLWFLGVYAVVTALTPVAVAAERRLGTGAALLSFGAVIALDLLHLAGPLPEWTGYGNLILVWLTAYLLGVSRERGRLRRWRAGFVLLGAVVGLILLTTRFGYPVSAVGVPGADRSNMAPPSALLPVLGAVQIGVAALLAPALGRILRRPVPWAAVAWLNLNALTVFCWHLTALSLPAVASSVLLSSPVAGLASAPEGTEWLTGRLVWLPAFVAVTGLLCLLFGRFERPWAGWFARPGTRFVFGVGTAVFAVAAVLLY